MATDGDMAEQVPISHILSMLNEMREESKQAFGAIKLRLESVESQQIYLLLLHMLLLLIPLLLVH